MRKYYLVLLYWILFLPFPVYAGDIAIIVNLNSPLVKIDFHQVQKIFKKDIQYLKGRRIDLVLRESETPEMKIILKKIYRRSPNRLDLFWLAKIFKGEILRPPKILSSHKEVTRFIGRNEDGFGFMDASDVNNSVRVLQIDGKLPGEEGYILSD